ncbi:MAG: UbiD family decarboxylase [Candidatus Undinarchaeales archaeon]
MRFKEALEKVNPKRVEKEFKPDTELAEYISTHPEPLIFENVNGWKVGANLCLRENVNQLLGFDVKKKMVDALENRIEPKIVEENNFVEIDADLTKLPILTHFKADAGPYFTSSVYIAESEKHGRNISYHRTRIDGKDRMVARITHRDLWKYYTEAGKTLDVAICIGLSPSLLIAAGTSVDSDIDEISIAGALDGKPVELVKMENGVHVPKDAEIVILAKILPEEDDEGPFIDLTGTVDMVRQQPVVNVEKIYTQKDPIYHALVSSKDEHGYLMGFPKEPVILNAVSKTADVKDVALTKGGTYWLHCAVSLEKGDPKEIGEEVMKAHKSVKHVFIYDSDIDIYNPDEREWAMATRFQAHKDMHTYPKSRGSSIDPSSKPTEDRQETTKVIFDCTIPKDKDKKDFIKGE